MSYTVKSSEKLRKSGAETETKALLYLMNFRSDSDDIYYFVVDFFNDLTGRKRSGNADRWAFAQICRLFWRFNGLYFARCDDPHGKLYEAKPPVDANNPELRKFVEMCFDPESPMNEKLKEAMLKMLEEAKQWAMN